MNNEINKEIEKSAEKKIIDWLLTLLTQRLEMEFDEDVVRVGLHAYLKVENKNILELNEEDKNNIFADLSIQRLDEEIKIK